jgi:hypothetical protein
LAGNTTGSFNTASGVAALYNNTTASNNTAVGYQAGYSNTTGYSQVAVGRGALYSNTTGYENTAVGTNALYTNSDGVYNAAFGLDALYSNTTGVSNVAIGMLPLRANTTGSNNVAVGQQAGYNNTTGYDNTFIGYQAGGTNTTGGYNTFVGDYSGYSHTTGVWNTLIGKNSGYALTTGSKNTIIGGYNGNQGGLDIRTSSNYIVLSDGDGNPRGIFDSSGNFMVGQTSTNRRFAVTHNVANFTAQIENSVATTPYGLYILYSGAAPNVISSSFIQAVDTVGLKFDVRSNGGIANFSANDVNLSDRREKTNFAPAKNYLDTICAIPVQTFNYIDQNMEEDGGLTLGVVAQDVQAVAPELVMESNWAGKDDEPKMRLSIYQTDLQYALMKCIQELKSELDTVKAELATLKGN